jgi:hypothetical protein
VSALLITLLPHLRNEKRRLPIFYYPSEHDEIMHGLGERHSPHTIFQQAQRPKQSTQAPACARPPSIWQKSRKRYAYYLRFYLCRLLTNS